MRASRVCDRLCKMWHLILKVAEEAKGAKKLLRNEYWAPERADEGLLDEHFLSKTWREGGEEEKKGDFLACGLCF